MVSEVVSEPIVDPRRSKDRSVSIETTNSMNSNSMPIKEVECIDIADDDDEPTVKSFSPPTKKQKLDVESVSSPPELTANNGSISERKTENDVDDKQVPESSDQISQKSVNEGEKIKEFVDEEEKQQESVNEEVKRKEPVNDEVKRKEPVNDEEKLKETVNEDEKARESYEKLLGKVTEHVHKQIDDGTGLQRKLMDVMLAAINREVLSDPMAIKELIVKKMLVLPNLIYHPPSQVLQMIMEHDPEHPLNRIITQLSNDQKPKETEQEKIDKARYKRDFPAPTMTRLVAQIGHDLVQEHTYGDIVHARNLPEIPKDMEGYKRVAEQLKPVWSSLREKNMKYKTRQHICRVCRFKSDSLVEYSKHTWLLHHDGKRYSCTLCPNFDNSEYRMKKHYLESHAIAPISKEEPSQRFDCAICDLDFKYKGELAAHLKECKRTFTRKIMNNSEKDHITINQWLWQKPEIEPSVAPKKPVPPPQPRQKVVRNMVGQPPMGSRVTSKQLPPVKLPPSIPSSSTSAPNQQTLGKLLPLLAQLSSNPPALEKIKNEQPELFKQLQGHFNQIRNNPQALAQLQKMNQKPATSRPTGLSAAKKPLIGNNSKTATTTGPPISCEICDIVINGKQKHLDHMQTIHKKLLNKTITDMAAGAPLACSKCNQRFWCYDGLERHLVMAHGLVTQEYLRKATEKIDGGRCQICKKQYAFNMLQHLVQEHKKNLCSAEIRYSCDVCQYSCGNYQELEKHLAEAHPRAPTFRQ